MNFVQEGKAAILIDGQWGSTGKGLLAAYLAMRPENQIKIATTNASANAGHTTILEDGTKFVTYHLPTFAVMQPQCYAYLNAGSIIDPELLMKEIQTIGFNEKKLFIHPHAAVITEEHKAFERGVDSANTKISSTQKGVGTALADKIKRSALLAKDIDILKPFIREIDLNNHTCVVEVPQGYSLSLSSGYKYPYVTSREITVSQALSDAGLHPSKLGKTIMSLRSFPIRVGSLEGHTSGPFYDDQRELTWEDLSVAPEITTVTKRIRRVFTFSQTQYKESLKILRPDICLINFLNYFKNENQMDRFTYEMMSSELEVGIMPSKLWGCGPKINEIFTNYEDAKRYVLNTVE